MKKYAIVNSSDLIGQELKEHLGNAGVSSVQIELLSTDKEQVGSLTEVAGAAAMVKPFSAEALADLDVAFLCGAIENLEPAIKALPSTTRGILLSSDGGSNGGGIGRLAVAGVTSDLASCNLLVSPAPSVVQLALLLMPLADLGLVRGSATVVQPASRFGSDALDELMEQTRKILAFHTPGGGEYFDRQMVFNLLPSEDQGGVEQQLKTILSDRLRPSPEIAVQMVQGGIFHGLSASLLVEFNSPRSADEVTERLVADSRVQLVDDVPPGPVDAASSDKLLIARARPVAGRDNAVWIWSVMDNLTRGAALNAIDLAGLAD
jgi:aspartate-semialdehyde dehydrogenase